MRKFRTSRALSSFGRAVRRTSDGWMNMQKIGVYILLCSNGRYYVGSTENLERRLEEHRQGRVKSTKLILPIQLELFQPCESPIIARKLEYRVKKLKSRQRIEEMIRDQRINLIDSIISSQFS